MTLEPLLTASPAIQIHVVTALAAVALGIAQLLGRRGSPMHRRIGWMFVLAMVAVCFTSFFIHEIRLVGRWSPIHLLSIGTLASLAVAIVAIRRGAVRVHRYTLISVYVFGLIGAGAFTFVPGRIMYAVAFGG